MRKALRFITIALAVLIIASAAFANPQQAKQYLDYGNRYLKAKQYDNAIKYYQYSIKLNPTTDAYYAMGTAYYYKGDKANALSNFQYALKLNPANANAAKMVSALGGGAGAAGAAGGKEQAYLVTGHKYLKARQYDTAIKYYQASARIQPTYQAYQFMGTAYYYKGDMGNAKLAYEKSLQLNPNNPGVRSVLAKIGGGAGAAGEPRLGQQIGVHPLLLAVLFAGAIAILFVF